MTNETVKALANDFLTIADELNELVSAYFNGSNDYRAEDAYRQVMKAEKKFTDAVNELYSESYRPCLNYELAESFI